MTLFGFFPKIFKTFGKLSESLFLHSPVLFQKRHEPLLQVTDRPLIFSCMLLISNHMTFLIQFEVNLHA